MIESTLAQILMTAFSYGVCGSLVAAVVSFINRSKPGPRFDQAAAIGFLVGGAFGAFFGIFQAMLLR